MPGEPAGKPKASTDFRLDGGAHSAEGTAVTPSVDRREGRIAAALTPPKRMPEGALLIACSSKHPANTAPRLLFCDRVRDNERHREPDTTTTPNRGTHADAEKGSRTCRRIREGLSGWSARAAAVVVPRSRY